MKKIFQKVRMAGVIFCLLVLPELTMGQRIVITAGVDNMLYETSTDSSSSDTVYSSSYNGVGTSRDASMNEYWVWESLIWFDLSPVMGKKIKKAEVELTPEVLAVDAYGNTYYYLAVVADPWNGSTVTMNNQPRVYTGWWQPFDVPTSTIPIALDVTDPVKYWSDGTYVNYGFALKDNGGLHDYSYNYATFFGSIEKPGTTPPRLIVDFEGDGNNDGVAIVPSIIIPLLLQ
jgi:hypothetical protein